MICIDGISIISATALATVTVILAGIIWCVVIDWLAPHV